MRIGIDCRLWNESGVGRYIRNLVKYLQILDKENEYILFVKSKDYQRMKDKGLRINWKIVKADVKWHTIEEQLKFPSILNKEKLDLVHFPYFSVPIFYSGKFVVTIHDLIINKFDTGKASTLPLPLYKVKRLGYKIILRQAVKKSAKIITVSNATKGEIVDHLGVNPDKVVVTYEGIDHKILNSKSQILNNFQNTKYKTLNTKYFLYVGNAYPHKNLERLLEAFKKIYNLKPKTYNLVLVGKEDYFYRKLKEKVKKMNLVDNVIFYGEVTDEELSELYKNAKALILPSLMEGFGLPAVEAMTNKCLVLASNIVALREVCGNAAVYFNPYDIDDIAEKMKSVCFNDLPAGEAGLNHQSKNIEEGLKRAKMFSWEKMAKETLKIYENSVSLR